MKEDDAMSQTTKVPNKKNQSFARAIPLYNKEGKLVRVRHALCQDGIRRSVRIKGRQDWEFEISATIDINGKTISGVILREGKDYFFKILPSNPDKILLPGIVIT